ncbi:MAG: Maf family nucleotide pyrophosphatase [Bacteroidota bacterium]|nr:Maf family nucleotide pyrophosphatase [Bacteroidota bacterium]
MNLLHHKINDYHLILASASPRRISLLTELNLTFESVSLDVDEVYPPDLKGHDVARYLARLKAEAFPDVKLTGKTILITADTIVCLNDEILGKPDNREHAIEMLHQLSGQMHKVITGVCLRSSGKESVFSTETDVYFRKLSDEEIRYYVDQYHPFDKAGAYGIQEWIGYIGIEKIEGSYFNVMGLPVQQLYDELTRFIMNCE